MPSGKGPGFRKKKLQNDWIDAQMPAYILKISYGKPTTPNQPLPKDDDDLCAWVRRRCEAFELEFKAELEEELGAFSEDERPVALKRIRNQFEAKFCNRKSAEKALWQKKELQRLSGAPPTASSKPKPSFILLNNITPTARTLFEQDSREAINAQVNATRAEEHIDYKKHAAMYQSEVKRCWDNLPVSERQAWEDKATVINTSDNVYRNQTAFVEELTNILCGLIGSGPNQIGNAAIQLLYGFRDSNETLRSGSIAVRANPEDSPFDEYDTKFVERTMIPWQKYCQNHIGNNRVEAAVNDVMECDDQGRPIFPTIDEDALTVQEVRQVLSDYIKAQWSKRFLSISASCHNRLPADHTNSSRTISWEGLTDDLSLGIRDKLFMLGNPRVMTIPSLFTAVAFIKSYQHSNGAFDLFKDKSPSYPEKTPSTSPALIPVNSRSISSPVSLPPHTTLRTIDSMTPTLAAHEPFLPDIIHRAPMSTECSIGVVARSNAPATRPPRSAAHVPTTTPEPLEPSPPTGNTGETPPTPPPTAPSPTNDPVTNVIEVDPTVVGSQMAAQTQCIVDNTEVKSMKRQAIEKTTAAPSAKRRKLDPASGDAPRRSARGKAKAPASIRMPTDAYPISDAPTKASGKEPRKNNKFWVWEAYVT